MQADLSKDFIRTNLEANKVLVVQRRTNALSHFLTIIEFGGGGRQGMGVSNTGWRNFGMEVRKL
jgi:hypothetical protein